MKARQQMARKISNKPTDYKICEGCDSIVLANALLCPNCHSYRYNSRVEDIISQAELLGAREQTSVTAEDMV